MDADSFQPRLHSVCESAVAEYSAQYQADDLIGNKTPVDDDALATRSDVLDQFAALIEIFDALFDVDSGSYHEEWREHLIYDPPMTERLRLLLTDLPASVTLVDLEARYAPSTGHIGISTGKESPTRTAVILASELSHAYQDAFASPTWENRYLREGFELAASTCALARLASDCGQPAYRQAAAFQRTVALIEGVLAHGVAQGGITEAALADLGIPDSAVRSRRANKLWRPMSQLNPRYYWDTTAFLPEYHLVGSVLLVSDAQDVDRTFARAFVGEHPWQEFLEQLAAAQRPWVGRFFP